MSKSKVGTATAANVLSGKTFTNSSGIGLTGTMKNNGAWTNTPTSKGKVAIPAGHHNGSGYVDTTNIYEQAFNSGITEAITSGALHSDYVELILLIGYSDRNSNEPYANEVFRFIIHNKNNIEDQNLLSGSLYFSNNAWHRTITTHKDVSGEFNFNSNASSPRTLNIWGRIAWL